MTRNKVPIKINGKEYIVTSNETDEYMHKVAKYIDKKISEIAMSNNLLNIPTVSILAAINITDEYFKSVEATDNLRLQVAQFIEDVSKDRTELLTLKKDNERLKMQIQQTQIEIARKDLEIQNLRKTSHNR